MWGRSEREKRGVNLEAGGGQGRQEGGGRVLFGRFSRDSSAKPWIY